MSKKSVKLYTDNVLEEFYNHTVRGSLENLHIPHSDVFYVTRSRTRITMVDLSLKACRRSYDC